jgi:hypothetical protein
VAELDEHGQADYSFHLDGTSGAVLAAEDVPADVFDATTAIALGGLGILAEPMASTLRGLIPTAARRTTVLLDPNCRPRAIKDLAGYRRAVEGFWVVPTSSRSAWKTCNCLIRTPTSERQHADSSSRALRRSWSPPDRRP